MKVEVGSYGIIESPPRLIDANAGTVYLRLVPHFLERLHTREQKGDVVTCEDEDRLYQWSVLRDTKPVDVTLRGGMSTKEAAAGLVFECAGDQWSRSWWRWIAYALTPCGWVNHPTPQFITKRRRLRTKSYLASLCLVPSCGNEADRYMRTKNWLTNELGPPSEKKEGVMNWRYRWGGVSFGLEPRDQVPAVEIFWEPYSSELSREIEKRLTEDD